MEYLKLAKREKKKFSVFQANWKISMPHKPFNGCIVFHYGFISIKEILHVLELRVFFFPLKNVAKFLNINCLTFHWFTQHVFYAIKYLD